MRKLGVLALLGLLILGISPVRAEVAIITTNPINTLPPGFEAAAQSLSNEFGKAAKNRNGTTITQKLQLFRVMVATQPSDPDLQCWLGVANVLMAERMNKSRSKYTTKASEAFAAAKTADTNNICVQCVMIAKIKQSNQMQYRNDYPATDAQCSMLPPAPNF